MISLLLLLIVVSVAGLVFGEDDARGEIQAQRHELTGEQDGGAGKGLLASVGYFKHGSSEKQARLYASIQTAHPLRANMISKLLCAKAILLKGR